MRQWRSPNYAQALLERTDTHTHFDYLSRLACGCIRLAIEDHVSCELRGDQICLLCDARLGRFSNALLRIERKLQRRRELGCAISTHFEGCIDRNHSTLIAKLAA